MEVGVGLGIGLVTNSTKKVDELKAHLVRVEFTPSGLWIVSLCSRK
jgi:hypothetical protein